MPLQAISVCGKESSIQTLRMHGLPLCPVEDSSRYRETRVEGRRSCFYGRAALCQGALSSWPSFALLYHVLVQRCAELCGISGWFEDSAILGDDLVIGHEGGSYAGQNYDEENGSSDLCGENHGVR